MKQVFCYKPSPKISWSVDYFLPLQKSGLKVSTKDLGVEVWGTVCVKTDVRVS